MAYFYTACVTIFSTRGLWLHALTLAACSYVLPYWHGSTALAISLIPRPLPDFISQPWRKIERRPGIIAMPQIGNGGLG